jgi:hypothetical protein
VLSHLDGPNEYGRYSGEIPVERDEWIALLQKPPHTTSQVCVVIVKVDTAASGLSYVNYVKSQEDRDGGEGDTSEFGEPTLFLSHAWRYDFKNLVGAVEGHFEDTATKEERASAFIWNDIFVENQVRRDALCIILVTL